MQTSLIENGFNKTMDKKISKVHVKKFILYMFKILDNH